MRGALLAVLACTGCDRVFGLTELPTPGTVRGTVIVRWTENDTAGKPVMMEAPRTASDATLTLHDVNGDLDIALGSDGAFSFPIRDVDDTYVLTLTTANTSLQYQLTAPELQLVERYPTRKDRVIAEPNTRIDLTINGRPSLPLEYVSSTGVWLSLSVPMVAPISVDWAALKLGVLEGAKHDDLYYAAFEIANPGVREYYRTALAARLPDTTLVQGQTTLLTMTPSAVPLDSCVAITAARRAELDRLIALTPNDDVSSTSIAVAASPAPDFGLAVSISLAHMVSGGLVVDDLTDEPFAFGNPYVGTQLYAQMSIGRQRTLTGIGALITGTWVVVPIEPGTCPVARILLDSAVVAIPTSIALDGRQLTTDRAVTFDDDSVLSWQLTSNGDADHFVVRVFEVTTAIVQRYAIATTGHSVKLDPTSFEPQHQYVIYVEARLGMPKAADGNFRELGPFWARGIAHTPVLTAQ